jgi:putative FmdB family regulatory protein
MPIYEYECENCGVRFERLQRMTDASLTDCPECAGHVHRVMQPVGVIFKGSGFYVTDNRGKSSTGIPPKKREEEAKPSSASESESSSAPAASTTPASSSSSASSNSPANSSSSGASDSASSKGGSKDGKAG